MKNLTKIIRISLATLIALSMGAWAECSDDVDMGGNKITTTAETFANDELVPKGYVNGLITIALEEFNPMPNARFTRDDDIEVVTDSKTGLMWQDNEDAKTIQQSWLTEDDYIECEAKVDDGVDNPEICRNNPPKSGTAQRYCYDLVMGNLTDWRLPTQYELEKISKDDVGYPAISGIFQNTALGSYWSTTLHGYSSIYTFNFNDHQWNWVYGMWSDTSIVYTRCVRDGL